MTLIKWTEQLSLGIDEVDREHRQLIELINSLHDTGQAGSDGPLVAELLEEIYLQIDEHFANEEALMHVIGYRLYREHKEDHEILLDELREFMDEAETEGSFDATRLSSDLNRWFMDHFHTHDAKLHKETRK